MPFLLGTPALSPHSDLKGSTLNCKQKKCCQTGITHFNASTEATFVSWGQLSEQGLGTGASSLVGSRSVIFYDPGLNLFKVFFYYYFYSFS